MVSFSYQPYGDIIWKKSADTDFQLLFILSKKCIYISTHNYWNSFKTFMQKPFSTFIYFNIIKYFIY